MAMAGGLGVRGGGSAAELVRLRSELDSLHRQLEEERAYYAGQLENQRRQAEKDALRQQAAAVAQRRRGEEELAALRAELAAALGQLERLRRSHDELAQRLLQVEAEGERQRRDEVERVLASAKDSWRMAEQELARTEADLARARDQLEQEREHSRRLQQAVAQLRRQLAEAPPAAPAAPAASAAPTRPASAPAPVSGRAERDADEGDGDWRRVKIADSGAALADEFLGSAADDSYSMRPVVSPPAAVPVQPRPPAAAPVVRQLPRPPQTLRPAAAAAALPPAGRRRRWPWVLGLSSLLGLAAAGLSMYPAVLPWLLEWLP